MMSHFNTEAALCAKSFHVLSRFQSGTEEVVRLDVALAALAAERERWIEACCAAMPPQGVIRATLTDLINTVVAQKALYG